MANKTRDRPRLTPKGERVRARIVEAAAALIHERGVAAATLEDVKAAADVSGSQLYHYFPDKNDLVQAVIGYQADTIVKHNRQALGSPKGVEAWRKMAASAGSTPADEHGHEDVPRLACRGPGVLRRSRSRQLQGLLDRP
jgi:AcrR family transcriptional regulator